MEILKILIIDDEGTAGYAGALQDFLKGERHKVQIAQDAEAGIKTMSNYYDMVFIDYHFNSDTEALTGADVGLKIREKCPLAPLILMTAYGSENIRNFIYVGFDDYLPKKIEGEMGEDREVRKRDCIIKAQENAQKRIKSIFSDDELLNVKERLDRIEETIKFLQSIKKTVNGHTIAAGVALLDDDKKLENNIELFGKLIYASSKKELIKKHQLITYNALSEFFQIRNKDGKYLEKALKTRQLLKQNAEYWQNTKKYCSPVSSIVSEFCL
jgi:CheY-like chemotaxis protein